MLAVTWLPGDTVAENLVAVSAVIVAVGVIWQKAIKPVRNGVRKFLAQIERVETAVKKTEAQTNGDLNAKFDALDKRFDTLESGQSEIRALVISADSALALHIDKFHPSKETP